MVGRIFTCVDVCGTTASVPLPAWCHSFRRTPAHPLNPIMSKRPARAQASSARAATSAFGSAFGSSTPAFGTSSSQLSHVTEPPDFSTISDANVVVYFKNLSKKDSTTKARALEDLQAHVAKSEEPVEEGLLEAWVRVPRACTYRPGSNLSRSAGQNVSSCFDRQRPLRAE
jgi:hypothetical protein